MARKPVVELAMIVRNGGDGLARAILSAQAAVDRIVIGDTGSTDSSVATARNMGAFVFHVPWENDFSQARNAVLQACRGDWVLILDADEMLDPAGAASIPQLTAQSQVDAWEVWKWHYIRAQTSRSGVEPARINPCILPESGSYPAYTRSPNTLLFRRRPDVYFEYTVHETVSRRIHKLGLRTAEAPFVIHHFGYAEETAQQRREKLEQYHQMGLRKAEAHPLDYWAHYELGLSELEHRHNPQQALANFENALKLNPEFAPGWLYAGICLTRSGRYPQALACLARAEEKMPPHGPVHPLLCEAKGDAFFHGGEIAQAEQQYRLAGRDTDLSPLAACKLGACEVQLGKAENGLARIEAAVEREPQTAELYDIWVAAAMLAGDIRTAAQVARQRLRIGQPSVHSFVLAAGLQARLEDWRRAVSILEDGIGHYPNDAGLRREWKIAMKRGNIGG
ncbi:TPR domain-containing glycosyltransferase [Silvibacterium dinghuense]|uniref:Tetratricopeptide repeat protein n=1 Tax=Silvibacterium dinghuense TaxID=1560006 RepID=A0A4Q1S8U3_9BACT|nr:TPR domain-containing glycosyltransferase [Silvibacterium dinghuense]RXS93309.1 tetratricopeptide repeat protein [Silvibacterium dinghuense]GGH04787.1 glycosyl transferase [Silvibacterium dinghuense]